MQVEKSELKQLDIKAMGARIRKSREMKRLTREKLAEEIDVSVNFLADVEYGNKGTSCKRLYILSQTLDVSADYLLSGRYSPTDYNDEAVRAAEEVRAILMQCSKSQLQSIKEISVLYADILNKSR